MISGIRDWILVALVLVSGVLFYQAFIADLSGDLKGNADTASAFNHDPADCRRNTFANAIASNGDLGCDHLSRNIPRKTALRNIFLGDITAASFSGHLFGNVTGNADTATAFNHDPSDCATGNYANAISSGGNLSCSNDGSSLTNINADNITSGTLNDDRLSDNVALLDRNNQTFTGSNNFNSQVNFRSDVNLGNDSGDTITANGAFYANNGVTVQGGDVNVNNGGSVYINDAGTLYVDGTSEFNGDGTFDNNLTVQGTTTLNGDVFLGDASSDDITVNGRLLGPNGLVTVGRLSIPTSLKVWGGGDFRGDVTVGGFTAPNASLDVRGDTTLGTDSNDDVTVNGRLYGESGGPVTIGHYAAPSSFKVWGPSDFRGDVQVGGFGAQNASLNVRGNSTLGNSASDTTTINGDLTVNGSGTFTGNVTAPLFIGDLQGNADTATALAADPTDCTVADTYATAIDDQGNLTCSGLPGNVAYTDAANVFTADQTIKLDSLTAFSVQNSGGDEMLGVNTAGNQVNIGSALNGAGLYVANGDVTVDGAGAVVVSNGNIQAVAGQFIGDGGGLTNISDNALSSNVAKYNDPAPTFTNGLTAPSFTGALIGNADTATALAADGSNCDPSTQGFAVGVDASGNGQCSTDGSGLTGVAVNGSDVSGDISGNAQNVNGIVAVLNGGTGADNASDARTNLGLGDMAVQNANGVIITGGSIDGTTIGSTTPATGVFTMITGDGTSVSNVDAANLQGQAGSYYTNASNLTSGTLPDGRLSTNVTVQGNTFNGASQLVKLTAAGKLPVLDGSNLTNLTLSQITDAGTIASQNANNVAITGGTIDGTTVGITTPAAAKFTNLTTTGAVDFSTTTSVKLPITAVAITDGVTACSNQARILFTTASNHLFVCDGTFWQQLDN